MNEPKERPIIFNTEMVQAILEGKKTQTRRLNYLHEINKEPNAYRFSGFSSPQWSHRFPSGGTLFEYTKDVPHYEKKPDIFIPSAKLWDVDDLLYVRETWYPYTSGYDMRPSVLPENTEIEYKATCHNPVDNYTWKPSIHMPKKFARIWLRVLDVRVERLQEITWQDAKAEGIRNEPGFNLDAPEYFWRAFRNLWDSINAKHVKKTREDGTVYYPYAWKENPYVWVVEFERTEQ